MRGRLILNGKKAGLPAVRAAVTAVRDSGHTLDVRVTWEAGDARRFVAEAAADGVDRVIAGGGDGSVSEVAAALMDLDTADRPEFGLLPLGTANDFATACGVATDPGVALLLAVTVAAVPVDVGRVDGGWFVNVATGGFGAAVTAETPVELKNFIGGGAYTIMGLLRALDFRPYACSIDTAGGTMTGEFVVGAICNGRQAGGGQRLAPQAVIDDGLFDVVFLRPFPVAAAPQVAAELATRTADGEFVVHRRLSWLELGAPAPIPVNLDGEPRTATRYRFECVPRALRVALPQDCPCLGAAHPLRS